MADSRTTIGSLRLRVSGLSAREGARLGQELAQQLRERLTGAPGGRLSDVRLRLTKDQASSAGEIAKRIAAAVKGGR